MNTRSRLDAVLTRAFPVPFDDNSKFVFIGDVHRGDNSLSDEFGRNIEQDTLRISGDLDRDINDWSVATCSSKSKRVVHL